MQTILSTLLLFRLGFGGSSAPILRVDLVFGGASLPAVTEASAMTEVTQIWAAYGVDIERVDPQDPGRDGALRLPVVIVNSTDFRRPSDRLGSIQFVGDVPRPAIALYLDSIATIVVTTELLSASEPEFSVGFRDLVVGRVLGRTLAHEIGHYLLRSRRHSGAGLMQAAWPANTVMRRDRRGFTLSHDEVLRLSAMVSARADQIDRQRAVPVAASGKCASPIGWQRSCDGTPPPLV